jgi:hypothetical protein
MVLKKLQICVDFWSLNATTKKYLYPLPFIEEVLDKITSLIIFGLIVLLSQNHYCP